VGVVQKYFYFDADLLFDLAIRGGNLPSSATKDSIWPASSFALQFAGPRFAQLGVRRIKLGG